VKIGWIRNVRKKFWHTFQLKNAGDYEFPLLVIANFVPSSLVLLTLMMEAICSSKTLILTRATHSLTSQMMAFFVVTAVKLTYIFQLYLKDLFI
jgi:hypothetical protein